MRSAVPDAIGRGVNGPVWRRGFAVVVLLVTLLAGAAFGQVPAVAPAPAAPAATAPDVAKLRVVEYGGGTMVFDGLIADIAANAGPAVQLDVEHADYAGFRAFCQEPYGPGPDILLTTRRILSGVASSCSKHDARRMAEIELGRGAIVLAVRRDAALTQLTSHQVYLALARDVPYRDEFRRNTAIRWSDIDRALPPEDIRFQLPPRDAGGRWLFEALVLEVGCRDESLPMQIFLAQPRTARCVTTRVDRVREIARDQAVRELLEAPVGTVGVLSAAEVALSGGALVALSLDGVAPTAGTIVHDLYGVSGSYWMYVRRGQPGAAAAVDAALTQIVARAHDDAVIGEEGVLTQIGMLPLPADERDAQHVALSEQTRSYGLGAAVGWVASVAGDAWSLTGLSSGEINPPGKAGSIDLTRLMGIAGFKVKEFETSVGIIPRAGMSFGIVRQMSQGDHYYLERTLFQDSRRRPGLLSAIQRRIVEAIITVSSTKGYQVSNVDISLFPLPAVTLSVTPSEAPPLSPETTMVMQALERVQERLSENGR